MKKNYTLLLPIRYALNRKKSFQKYSKHVVAIIACIVSLNTASAQVNYNWQEEYYTIVVRAPKVEIPEEVTINGSVKDEAGNLLANAKVKSDYGQELLTDNNGSFSFKLKKEQVTTQSIFVSYENLVTAVRSYHPSMVNTTYDITLYKPTVCCKKIKHCEGVDFKAFVIDFKNKTSNLTEATQKQLDGITNSLKECPTGKIQLTVHTGNNKSLQRFAGSQLDAVKKYLVEQNGITIDRIKTDEVIDAVGNNSIDVTPE